MILTAKEAGTKRCQEGFGPGPMSPGGCSHVAISSQSFGAAYVVATSPTNCIAGGCMAWRWTGRQTIDGDFTGYCGKAVR